MVLHTGSSNSTPSVKMCFLALDEALVGTYASSKLAGNSPDNSVRAIAMSRVDA
jgi:hypothetical protein